MTEATFIYGKISLPLPLYGLTPNFVAKKFNANLAELYILDSKQNLITIDNDKFDSELSSGESYKVYDNKETPHVEAALVTPLTNKHVLNFRNSLEILFPAEKINSNIKLQGLAQITMNANDISLEDGNYKFIKKTNSLRAAVHDLTSNVTKAYLEGSGYASEIHSGLNNVLKAVPDMLKEVDNPNSDSKEVLQDLESWMTKTLEECYGQSKKGAQQTEELLEHVYELESAIIASLGNYEKNTNSTDKNDEMLQLLKKQQKRFEEARLVAKHEIEKAWESKKLNENAQEEYETARENYNKKKHQIVELEFKIEQAIKNGAKNEDILTILRECISEIMDIKENWTNASSALLTMKNTLRVEKDAKRWESATESLKIDLNKRCLIRNMLQFLQIGYKIDYWMNIQNQIIKDHLLPLASSANNVFRGDKAVSIKNDVPEMIKQATAAILEEQKKMVKEYESDLRECLSLQSVVTIFQSDCTL